MFRFTIAPSCDNLPLMKFPATTLALRPYLSFLVPFILATSIQEGFSQLPPWGSFLIAFAIYTTVAGLYAGVSWILVPERASRVENLQYFVGFLILLGYSGFMDWFAPGRPLWLVIVISIAASLIVIACMIARWVFVSRKCGPREGSRGNGRETFEADS